MDVAGPRTCAGRRLLRRATPHPPIRTSRSPIRRALGLRSTQRARPERISCPSHRRRSRAPRRLGGETGTEDLFVRVRRLMPHRKPRTRPCGPLERVLRQRKRKNAPDGNRRREWTPGRVCASGSAGLMTPAVRRPRRGHRASVACLRPSGPRALGDERGHLGPRFGSCGVRRTPMVWNRVARRE